MGTRMWLLKPKQGLSLIQNSKSERKSHLSNNGCRHKQLGHNYPLQSSFCYSTVHCYLVNGYTYFSWVITSPWKVNVGWMCMGSWSYFINNNGLAYDFNLEKDYQNRRSIRKIEARLDKSSALRFLRVQWQRNKLIELLRWTCFDGYHIHTRLFFDHKDTAKYCDTSFSFETNRVVLFHEANKPIWQKTSFA